MVFKMLFTLQVYDIDGIGNEDANENDRSALRDCRQDDDSPTRETTDRKPVKSSKQILLNAGQKSEFDSGMNNTQIHHNTSRDNRSSNSNSDTTYCTPVYGQIVSTRENHIEINDIQQKFAANETTKPSSSFRKDWNPVHGKTTEGWDEFSKRNISTIKSEADERCTRTDKSKVTNGKHYDFFPVFDNKTAVNEAPEGNSATECTKHNINEDNSKIILDPMQKLVLHSTDIKICDNKSSALSS